MLGYRIDGNKIAWVVEGLEKNKVIITIHYLNLDNYIDTKREYVRDNSHSHKVRMRSNKDGSKYVLVDGVRYSLENLETDLSDLKVWLKGTHLLNRVNFKGGC